MALAFSYDDNSQIFQTLIDDYNKYAENNNLNITVNIEIIKYEKPTDSITNFKSFVEESLKKNKNSKKNKFDIYFYDNRYTNMYGQYLIDLKDSLPEELLKMYDTNSMKEACFYNDELVGIPVGFTYEILYSNTELLNKYNKSIPKTWDELIDTCKYIMEKEKDNPELICYNGLFDDSVQGLHSLYEFIYSCRETLNSTYPDPKSQSFKDSLTMLKKLKEQIATDEIFGSNENFTFATLLSGKAIFLKYWFIGEPLLHRLPYKLSILPGKKGGISGSMAAGCSVSITKNIAEDKKEKAFEVVKYVASTEYQRKLFENKLCITPLNKFLNDEEICKNGLCDIAKDIQFTGEPKFILDGPEDYGKRYQKYIYQYLYENKTIDETLKQINDIIKIHYVSLNSENTYVGLIYFVFIIAVSILMLLSLVFLFVYNFQSYFIFLSEDLWIVTVLGSILILLAPCIDYGRVTVLKCHLKPLLLSIGYTLNICPVTYKLMTQFPEKHKTFLWIKKHRYIFLMFFILADLLLNGISLIKPYTLELTLVEDGENFLLCNYNGGYDVIILLIYKSIVILFMLFLIFVEWNIPAIKYDIKLTVSALYTDILSIIFIGVFYIFEIKNYISHFIIQTTVISIISISNYLFLYGIRLVLGFIGKKKIEFQFIDETQVLSRTYDSSNKSYKTIEDEENGNISPGAYGINFISRMINYHYTNESNTINSREDNNCPINNNINSDNNNI